MAFRMRNIRLTVSYDGSEFHGWQTQPGLRTVQETLEGALCQLTQERVRLNASGRTDTGVHALGQVANFQTGSRLGLDVLVRGANAHLPADIVVREAAEAAADFDANRDAVRKLYRYVLHDGEVPDLFLRNYCWHIRYRLDAAAMARAGRALLGTHDFRSFETEWPNRASSVRTITHLSVNRFGHWIWFDVEADGFLYNMVRAMAGTLVNIGRGYWTEDRAAAILTACDRTLAGPTAPALGLFLMRVSYGQS
jgi:tRNA pseudouridine38-40 synthase